MYIQCSLRLDTPHMAWRCGGPDTPYGEVWTPHMAGVDTPKWGRRACYGVSMRAAKRGVQCSPGEARRDMQGVGGVRGEVLFRCGERALG